MKKRILLYALVPFCIQMSIAQRNSVWFAVGDNFFNTSIASKPTIGYYLQSINDSMAIRKTGYSTLTARTTIQNAFNFSVGISRTKAISKKLGLEYGVGINWMRFTAVTTNDYAVVTFSDQTDTIKYSTTKFNNNIDKRITYINPLQNPKTGVEYVAMDLVVPISLKYQLSKAFGVLVGAEVNSSLFAKSVIETNDLQKISETKEEVVYRHILTTKVNDNTQAIPRWGLSAVVQGHLNIDPNHTIALGVNYRMTKQLQENQTNTFFIGEAMETNSKFFRFYLKCAYNW